MSMPNAELLLGNHELMMRDCIVYEKDASLWMENEDFLTFREYTGQPLTTKEKIARYLSEFLRHADVHVDGKTYRLVHATPESIYVPGEFHDDPKAYSSVTFPEFAFYRYMKEYENTRLNREEFSIGARPEPNAPLLDNLTVVFGHTPTRHYNHTDPITIWFGRNRIGIDCRCAQPNGRLACLRSDDMETFYSDIIKTTG